MKNAPLFTPECYDLHVHTRFSPDSTAELEAYAQAAQQLSFHVGFLDHFELAFIDRPNFLHPDMLPELLEEFDRVHAMYPHTSISLELDFYADLEQEISEFCDEYRNEFQYLIGVVHTVNRIAVTVPTELDQLIKKLGLRVTLESYFDEVEAAIRSGLFDGFAHIDGAMRFLPAYPNYTVIKDLWRVRTKELCLCCRDHDVIIEVNTQGLRSPWGQTHPSKDLIEELIELGAQFYVGSDSHSVEAFINAAPIVREMTNYLRKQNALRLPFNLKAR